MAVYDGCQLGPHLQWTKTQVVGCTFEGFFLIKWVEMGRPIFNPNWQPVSLINPLYIDWWIDLLIYHLYSFYQFCSSGECWLASCPWEHPKCTLSSLFCWEFSLSSCSLRHGDWHGNFKYTLSKLHSSSMPPSVPSLVAIQRASWPLTLMQPALRSALSFSPAWAIKDPPASTFHNNPKYFVFLMIKLSGWLFLDVEILTLSQGEACSHNNCTSGLHMV